MNKAAEKALQDILIGRSLHKRGFLKKKQSARLMIPHFRILIQLATSTKENISNKERAHQRNLTSTKAGIKHGYSNISAFLHAGKYDTCSPKKIEKAAINLSKEILGNKRTNKIVDGYQYNYHPSLREAISFKNDDPSFFH